MTDVDSVGVAQSRNGSLAMTMQQPYVSAWILFTIGRIQRGQRTSGLCVARTTPLDRCQQPVRRIGLADKAVSPGVQSCLARLWTPAQGDHMQSRASVIQRVQRTKQSQPGQLPPKQNQVGTCDPHLGQKLMHVAHLTDHLKAWLLLQKHMKRESHFGSAVSDQDTHTLILKSLTPAALPAAGLHQW